MSDSGKVSKDLVTVLRRRRLRARDQLVSRMIDTLESDAIGMVQPEMPGVAVPSVKEIGAARTKILFHLLMETIQRLNRRNSADEASIFLRAVADVIDADGTTPETPVLLARVLRHMDSLDNKSPQATYTDND